MAIRDGDVNKVKNVIEESDQEEATLNMLDKYTTPLHEAVKRNSYPIGKN